MATEVTLYRTCPDIISRATRMPLTHDIIGWPTQGPAITGSFMRPRTACDIA
jgi:hypothetical protein